MIEHRQKFDRQEKRQPGHLSYVLGMPETNFKGLSTRTALSVRKSKPPELSSYIMVTILKHESSYDRMITLLNLKMISDTKFLSQLKLVKGAIKTPKSFAHNYFIFLLNFNIYLLKRTFHSSL